MRGVTMRVGTPIALAVILCLGVLDATYLERPLWVADKGRQQSVSFGNEEPRPSQFQPANEPSWVVPEPYRAGAVNQPTQDSPNAAQKVREERPPYQAYEPDTAYEFQPVYQGQVNQPVWMNQQQPQQQQQPQVEYQKPYPAYEPPKQQAQPEPEYYSAYGGFEQQGWNRESVSDNSPLNNYQSQFQTQEELYQPNRMDGYQPRPETDTKLSFNQPKPEPNPEPFPSKPEDLVPNTVPVRPQEVPQGYKPYAARPELYQPGPVYVPEPEYQVPYYGQQAFPSFAEPDQYPMQMSGNKQPTYQPFKPVEESNKVSQPTQQELPVEQAPPANMGYYPYQPQIDWYPYQQNPPAGLQASVQTGQEMRAGEQGFPLYQGIYDREPAVEKPKLQTTRKPVQPSRTEQRPNRPVVQRQPEQPNRLPSAGWEVPYNPVKPVEPVMPKPRPQQQRPPVVEPTYNRQPQTSYWDNSEDDDDDVVVKYEKPVTRFDARCPRDDDPAKPVHFPSATSCVKFQKCFNGIAYEMSCPPGLEFDSKNNRCDYPARARCSL